MPFIGGLPFYADGGDAHLPRSMALAFNWSRYDTQTREYFAQLQQSFGGEWKLKLNATSLDTAASYGYGAFDSPVDPITKALPVLPFALFSPSPNTQDQFVFDGTLTGSFELFGRRLDVAVGGDYTHFKGDVTLQPIFAFGLRSTMCLRTMPRRTQARRYRIPRIFNRWPRPIRAGNLPLQECT